MKARTDIALGKVKLFFAGVPVDDGMANEFITADDLLGSRQFVSGKFSCSVELKLIDPYEAAVSRANPLEIAKLVCSRFEFNAPMRITITAHPARADEIILMAKIWSMDRDGHSHEPVNITQEFVVPGRSVRAFRGDGALMVSYFKQVVMNMARELWMHEFDEWMKQDGVRVRDPHRRETRGAEAENMIVDDPMGFDE